MSRPSRCPGGIKKLTFSTSGLVHPTPNRSRSPVSPLPAGSAGPDLTASLGPAPPESDRRIAVGSPVETLKRKWPEVMRFTRDGDETGCYLSSITQAPIVAGLRASHLWRDATATLSDGRPGLATLSVGGLCERGRLIRPRRGWRPSVKMLHLGAETFHVAAYR